MIDMNEVRKKLTTISIKHYKNGRWICRWGTVSSGGVYGMGSDPREAVFDFCRKVLRTLGEY